MNARYTHMVRNAVSVILASVLAGVPCAATLCDVLCSDSPQPAFTHATHAAQPRHTPGEESSGGSAMAGDHANARHDHQRSVAPSEGAASESHPRLNGSLSDCCSSLATGSAPQTPARPRLVRPPQVAVPLTTASVGPLISRPTLLHHPPAPAILSHAARPLVLRI
jgi:hypothetical protein